ncbi:hypothetical protein [Dyadobacter arcticus]|uniref:Uncharacterized protein n=1 Tax=Dyadobacter arcticus TaxID=1078754 RepID=A0ABX0UKL1_9BACT|nr:hypothetical protein [Dyadobacter arcticus]NIJ53392.1 hypothetical protein [Dyadobacter arcticus]
METISLSGKERIMLDVSVTNSQKEALMTILKALDIDVKEHVLSDDEEDLALGLAMEEGRKEGIASQKERQEFESYLFGK